MYLLLYNLTLFSIVGIVFYKIYRNTIPAPSDPDIIFYERGGGWVGGGWFLTLQLTWPFVTIAIHEDRVSFNYGGKKVDLLYTEITSVDLFYIPIIAEGIRIRHNNLNQPSLLRFWSFGKSKKIKKLIDGRLNKTL